MESVTQQNASNSEECAASAEELKAQADDLTRAIDSLAEIVGISEAGAPAYATAVGLLQYGKLHQGQTVVDVREKASVTGWFKRVTNWLKGEF
jgi:cell division ATPase FtsA